MPKVTTMIDERRKEWGAEHVNACIQAGLHGKVNQFYAFEKGQIVGTAFTPDAAAVPESDLLRVAMLAGSAYMVMRAPEVANGKN